MEIKPTWLMEGKSSCISLTSFRLPAKLDMARLSFLVAPHYFKAADLEQLTTGEKKMPKAAGYSGAAASSTS